MAPTRTAYFLDLTVRSDKPIILVGAQRNASDRDFDGPRNLVNASRICVSETALGKGAMIVLNGQINAAREATKTHTSDVESFKSGDFGFLGVVDHDRVVFTRSPMRRQHVQVTGERCRGWTLFPFTPAPTRPCSVQPLPQVPRG
jgi:L-asparaginase